MSAASKSPNVMKIENGSQGRLTQISRFSYQNNDICDQNDINDKKVMYIMYKMS